MSSTNTFTNTSANAGNTVVTGPVDPNSPNHLYSIIPQLVDGEICDNLVFVRGKCEFGFTYNDNGKAINADSLFPSGYNSGLEDRFVFHTITSFKFDPKGKKIMAFVIELEDTIQGVILYQIASDEKLYRLTTPTIATEQGGMIASCSFLDNNKFNLKNYSEDDMRRMEMFEGYMTSIENFEQIFYDYFSEETYSDNAPSQIGSCLLHGTNTIPVYDLGIFDELAYTNCFDRSSFAAAFPKSGIIDEQIESPIPQSNRGNVCDNLVLIEGYEEYSVDYCYNVDGKAVSAIDLLPAKYCADMKEQFVYFCVAPFYFDPYGKKIFALISSNRCGIHDVILYQVARDGKLYRLTSVSKDVLIGEWISSVKLIDISLSVTYVHHYYNPKDEVNPATLTNYSVEEETFLMQFDECDLSFEDFEMKLVSFFNGNDVRKYKVGYFDMLPDENCHFTETYIYSFPIYTISNIDDEVTEDEDNKVNTHTEILNWLNQKLIV